MMRRQSGDGAALAFTPDRLLAHCQRGTPAPASASVSAQAGAGALRPLTLPDGNHGENHSATVTTGDAQDFQL